MLLDCLFLFLEFFKIGLFTFGGGYAMIPLVHETVDYGWISQDQFNNMIGLSEVTPGPIALNMATFVGATKAGFLGGVSATIGVVLPSFIIICIVAAILKKYSQNKYVKAALRGTMFVAIGLIIAITFSMSKEVLTSTNEDSLTINFDALKTFAFVLIGYVLLFVTTKKKPGPIVTIFMSLIIGLGLYFGILETILILFGIEFIALLYVKKTKN